MTKLTSPQTGKHAHVCWLYSSSKKAYMLFLSMPTQTRLPEHFRVTLKAPTMVALKEAKQDIQNRAEAWGLVVDTFYLDELERRFSRLVK